MTGSSPSPTLLLLSLLVIFMLLVICLLELLLIALKPFGILSAFELIIVLLLSPTLFTFPSTPTFLWSGGQKKMVRDALASF